MRIRKIFKRIIENNLPIYVDYFTEKKILAIQRSSILYRIVDNGFFGNIIFYYKNVSLAEAAAENLLKRHNYQPFPENLKALI